MDFMRASLGSIAIPRSQERNMKLIALQLVTVCLDSGQEGVFVGLPLVAAHNSSQDGQIEDIWFSDIQEVPAQTKLADLLNLIQAQLRRYQTVTQ
jgi:hypothetical protein